MKIRECALRVEALFPLTESERERCLSRRVSWSAGRVQTFCTRLADLMGTSPIRLVYDPRRGSRPWTVDYSPWGITTPGDRGWYRTPGQALEGIRGLMSLALEVFLEEAGPK